MKKTLIVLVSMCSLWVLNGCGSGSSTTTQDVATHFSVTSASATPTVGKAFNITVTALDAAGQMVAGYSGTVQLTSSSGQAVQPASDALTNGTGTFAVTLNKAGSQTITASAASLTGTSSAINVSAAAVATQFSVTAPGVATVGSAFNITVTALDATSQMVTTYSGTVQLTSSNGQAVQPASGALTNGTGTFSVMLNTTGSQTITATDASSIKGTSSAITVNAAAATNAVPFVNQPLSPEAAVPGGPGFTLTVNGTGFVSGSKVMWNGSARATTFVSESQLTASILASDIAAFNTASVTVVKPGPGGGTSNAVFFETTRPTSSVGLGSTSALSPGTAPSSVATAELTGNGKLDAVIANSMSNNISVFLGNGDGTFQAAANYAAGTNPNGVAVGDFNGDGKLDLAVGNNGSNNVSIFLGNGDGTFQAAVNYAAGTNPISVGVGDFDGDGKLDLAVANAGGNNVSILLGRGDGTFQAAVNYAAGTIPNSVAVGDFDGDGKLDLAVVNILDNNVSIFLGNGNGTFQAAVNYSAGTNPNGVAVGDFNGDGKLDLAVASRGSSNFVFGSVSILLGNGDGTFKAAVNYAAGYSSLSVVLGDFNGDGKLDLAVPSADVGGNVAIGSVSVFLGNGDGTFQPKMDFTAGTNPLLAAVGDFNGDGRLDMVVADQENSAATVLLQPGLVTGPDAKLSGTSLNFALQLLGTTSAAQTVQLTNYGTAALNISGIVASANFGETNTCDLSLAAGANCNISITFAPGAIDNSAGTITITDNAPGSPQVVSVSGVGTLVDLSPTSISFLCNITSCPARKVTLTNTGAAALSISSITISSPHVGNGHAFNQTNNCPASLAGGQFCTITVTFSGVFDTGYKGSLIVTDNGGGSPQMVSLFGIIQ